MYTVEEPFGNNGFSGCRSLEIIAEEIWQEVNMPETMLAYSRSFDERGWSSTVLEFQTASVVDVIWGKEYSLSAVGVQDSKEFAVPWEEKGIKR